MAKQSVQALLADIGLLSEDVHALVQAVRALVQKSFATCSEEVKYGGIVLTVEGLAFGGVFAYQQHVSVEFSAGAVMADPYGFLEGAGKGRRHIKLREPEDIAAKHVAEYLRLGWEAARTKA